MACGLDGGYQLVEFHPEVHSVGPCCNRCLGGGAPSVDTAPRLLLRAREPRRARTFLVFAGEKHDVHVEARHADKPLEQRDEKAAVRGRGAVAAFTQRAQGSMQHLDEDGDGQRVFEHAAQLRRL